MIPAHRWVVDTNTLVSHLLLPHSVPALSVRKALSSGDLLVSNDTLRELAAVLACPKFDRYLQPQERKTFFELFGRVTIQVPVLRKFAVCRDPKDDKFLDLAINGQADALITGDRDLLALNPFFGVPILTPKAFLNWPPLTETKSP